MNYTPEQYFQMGASAMQSLIAAQLMMKGKTDTAAAILDMKEMPRFQIPEKFEIKK